MALIIGTNKSSSSEQLARAWRGAASSSTMMALVLSLALAALYAPAALAGLLYAVVGSTVTLVWAPSGIALAALVLLGPRVALGVALGAFIANAWTDVTLAVAAMVALGNTLGALLGSMWFSRVTSFRNSLDSRGDVLAFIAIAAVTSTMVSAMVGASAMWLGGILSQGEWAGAFIKWWLGDMMGVLVVAPALMVWLGSTRPAITALKALEGLALGALLICATVLIFGESQIAGHGYYPAALGVFPFVIWGALRFGQRGSTLVTLGASALAVWGTTMGAGPFSVEHPVDSLVRWCAFAIVVAVTGLLLAASVTEQRRAQTELRRSHDDLEEKVNARTKELVDANIGLRREMSERYELENELVRMSEVHQHAMGRELHDGLGQHLTSLALHSASLKQQLTERALPEVSTANRIVELANEANVMARHLARGLYPVAMEFGGLVAALDRLAHQTRALGRMACVFRYGEDSQVQDSLVAINLYRVAQEAVNNAVKYSQASCVKIELKRIGEQYQMSISDDGIGIDFDRPSHSEGLGMHSMRYRAQLLGGTLSVAPLALGGTRVTVVVSEVRSQP